jgi:hypothetical protein
MASRQEEKQRRREERLAAERAAEAKASRDRRVRLMGGGVLAIVALAAAGIAIAASGGGKSDGGGNNVQPKTSAPGSATLPARKITDLTAAAKAAGCQVRIHPWTSNDRDHVKDGTKVHYTTNPPSFGDHYAVPSHDGNYVGQGTPPTGNLVHALEHGRIEIQYKPGLPKQRVAQLEALFDEKLGQYDPGQYLLLYENTTKMPYEVAATAWGRDLVCPKFTDKTFDALRAFRLRFTQKAPERSYLAPE